MRLYTKNTLLLKISYLLGMLFFCVQISWAQQNDSVAISLRNKNKKINHVPEIKANIQSYRPTYSTLSGSNQFLTLSNSKLASTAINKDKLLTVVKIFPNPVESQISIILSLTKDTQITYKIIDLLGNEVLTLANEHLNAGDQTRTFNIPNRLNPGIYFLRIVAGSESQIKRISVL